MDIKESKNKLILSICLVLVFLLSIGITYAYFTARILGAESTSTISLKGGKIEIQFKDNTNTIDLKGIYPREAAWAEKEFTVTGINTTDLTNVLNYKIGIQVENNTFTPNSLTYTLENTLNEAGTNAHDFEGVIYKING